jgi:hypothetical protein
MNDRDKELLLSWRGRRFLACTLENDLEEVIKNLGNGDEENPEKSMITNPISEEYRRELITMSTLLLRMILVANDGRVSPATLRRF